MINDLDFEGGEPRPRADRRTGSARQRLFLREAAISGFYATNLPVLLPQLGVSRVILTGGGGGYLRAVHCG